MRGICLAIASAASLSCSACVAGPGGTNNAANRTVSGAAIGAVLGGVVGSATGNNALGGAVVGAVAGGALGAAVNPGTVFRRDTRGYCYMVDEYGQPVLGADGQPVYDYNRKC